MLHSGAFHTALVTRTTRDRNVCITWRLRRHAKKGWHPVASSSFIAAAAAEVLDRTILNYWSCVCSAQSRLWSVIIIIIVFHRLEKKKKKLIKTLPRAHTHNVCVYITSLCDDVVLPTWLDWCPVFSPGKLFQTRLLDYRSHVGQYEYVFHGKSTRPGAMIIVSSFAYEWSPVNEVQTWLIGRMFKMTLRGTWPLVKFVFEKVGLRAPPHYRFRWLF